MTARSSSSSQKEYKKAGLVSINFPPNSGDLNPIETVWAKLRKDLAAREFEDLRLGKMISTTVFKQRVSQLSHSYGISQWQSLGRNILSWRN